MRHILGLEVPNILPDALGLSAAGRLIWTSLLFIVMLAPIIAMSRRPKPKLPTTWAQAMAGSVYVFALMILAYGSIPHEWLTYANGYHKWDESHFLVRSGQEIVFGLRWLNFDVNKRVLADTVATLIYIVLLSLNVALFAKWQKRPAYQDPATIADAGNSGAGKVVGTSAFGRPVTAKA